MAEDRPHERNIGQHEEGSEQHPRINPDLSIPENRHEHRDVNVVALGKFAIGLVIVTLFSAGIVAGVLQYLMHREGGMFVSRIVPPPTDTRQLPPEPRLEETPAQDEREMHAAEDKLQGTYGWLDQDNGIVRLPIARAMDLVVQEGLPSRQNNFQSAAAGVSVPTMSGLGAVLQQVGGPLAPQIQKGGVVPEGGK